MSNKAMLSLNGTLTFGRGFTLRMYEDIPLLGVSGVFGASGAGKSTLLRIIAGLEPRFVGQIMVDGADWSTTPAEQRRVGYVPQDLGLFEHLHVRDNLLFGAKRRHTDLDFDNIVNALMLEPVLDQWPHEL